MRSFLRVFGLAVTAAGLCVALGTPAQAGCVGLSGTADGFDRQTAVSRAQNALAQAVAEFKTQKRLGAISVSAMRATPQPYWRGSVSPNLYQKPDIVTSKSHTICWSGVVSPSVCTSGAKVCW
ncbi:MAG: hypothetical protein ACRECX_14935 [Methyloceanibacter sp.]|uniref:hypothetical protein n=1 Tax=Methyloceanibacter sp. TaxID=1965321 RepID=UPI003D6D55E0